VSEQQTTIANPSVSHVVAAPIKPVAPAEPVHQIVRLRWPAKRRSQSAGKIADDDPLSAFYGEIDRSEYSPKEQSEDLARRSRVRAWMLLVVATVALLEAGLIGYWMYDSWAVAAAATGSLRVTSRPAGGIVAIDGFARGTTPLALTLSKGEHRVEIRTADAVRRTSVVITAGAASFQDFDLGTAGAPAPAAAAVFGSLEVETEPSGASVRIDGVSQGLTPLRLTSVTPGLHRIVLTSAGQSVSRQVTVASATATKLVVPIIGSTAALSGWVQISSPITLQLYENGQLLGTTETERIMLPVGAHELSIVNQALDYKTTATLQVLPGRTTNFAVKLPTGSLYVNALPWADVWIDGQRVGETPLANLTVPIGTHEVLFRHPQLGEQRRTVVIKLSGTTRVGLEFGK